MASDKILGLDIGVKNIKIALLKNGKKPEIDEAVMLSTPLGAIADGEIANMDAVAAVIKKAVSQNKLNARKLAISINSLHTVTREIRLPVLKESEILPAVEFELLQSFPGISQTHYLSFKTYETTKDGIRGIVSCCPIKVVDKYTELGGEIGIPLKYIDVSSNSVSKAFYTFSAEVDPKATALIVDIGHELSSVSVVMGGRLVLSRSIGCGGSVIDGMVAERYGKMNNAAEADKLKRYPGYNFSNEDMNLLLRTGYAAVEEQIRQTLNFYDSSKYKEPITRIILIGGGSHFPGLEYYYSDMFRMPVSIVKPLFKNFSLLDLSMYMTAVGAALRED